MTKTEFKNKLESLTNEFLINVYNSNKNHFSTVDEFYSESTPTFCACLDLILPNSTAKCDTLQYQAANAISLKTIAGCLKPKHFFGR